MVKIYLLEENLTGRDGRDSLDPIRTPGLRHNLNPTHGEAGGCALEDVAARKIHFGRR